jgi:hypothetical protein
MVGAFFFFDVNILSVFFLALQITNENAEG